MTDDYLKDFPTVNVDEEIEKIKHQAQNVHQRLQIEMLCAYTEVLGFDIEFSDTFYEVLKTNKYPLDIHKEFYNSRINPDFEVNDYPSRLLCLMKLDAILKIHKRPYLFVDTKDHFDRCSDAFIEKIKTMQTINLVRFYEMHKIQLVIGMCIHNEEFGDPIDMYDRLKDVKRHVSLSHLYSALVLDGHTPIIDKVPEDPNAKLDDAMSHVLRNGTIDISEQEDVEKAIDTASEKLDTLSINLKPIESKRIINKDRDAILEMRKVMQIMDISIELDIPEERVRRIVDRARYDLESLIFAAYNRKDNEEVKALTVKFWESFPEISKKIDESAEPNLL